MVVRLNGKLYDKKEFESRGMKHVEMVSGWRDIFGDLAESLGSYPWQSMVSCPRQRSRRLTTYPSLFMFY